VRQIVGKALIAVWVAWAAVLAMWMILGLRAAEGAAQLLALAGCLAGVLAALRWLVLAHGPQQRR
jgi:hypothetical protein